MFSDTMRGKSKKVTDIEMIYEKTTNNNECEFNKTSLKIYTR